MASELKMASAFFLDSRSPISSSFASGRPMRTPLSRTLARPTEVVGALAAAFAVSWFGPEYRKYAVCGRSTRIRLSPGFRPEMGRRPPIIGSQAVRQPRPPITAPHPVAQPRHESLREREGGHRRLHRRDVERGPPPGRGAGVGVEQHPARGGDAVAGLPDAAGVEQHAPAVEAHLRAGARAHRLEPAVVLDVR